MTPLVDVAAVAEYLAVSSGWVYGTRKSSVLVGSGMVHERGSDSASPRSIRG